MTRKSLIGVMVPLFAATLAWGQAVPSQIANLQQNSRSGANGGNTIQLQYSTDHWGYNESQEAFIQFDMSVFPATLTATGVQKATLVLYVLSGGNPGTISICQVAQAWSLATITGTNAPSCTNTAAVTLPVSAAELQQGSFVSVDITHIVQSWLASGNYGIELVPQPPTYGNGINVQFSSMQGNPGFPPTLDLVLAGSGGGTGTQGATGAQGPTGSQGATGPAGTAGTAGAPGAKGATGANGATGAAGATGGAGPAGTPGATGSAGAKGATGAAGPTGANGAPGPTGAAGATGAIGPSGAQGLQGVPGALGPTGIQGSTGQQGTPGPTGAAGSIGPAGPAGTPGSNGSAGFNGIPGPTGATGPAGAGGGSLQMATTTLSNGDVMALGGKPITIVTGVPGTVILPMAMAMYAPGTSTYSADLSFQMAGQELYHWASALSPGLDYLSPSVSGNFIATQGGIFGPNSTWAGQSMTLQSTPEDPAKIGQGIVITIWYLSWPTAVP